MMEAAERKTVHHAQVLKPVADNKAHNRIGRERPDALLPKGMHQEESRQQRLF
jgi:hypothetical protein